MRVRDELLPSAISDCELVARSNGTDTQCRPAVGSAERLEDVEKVVMELKTRLFAAEQFSIDITDRLLDRIETLERHLRSTGASAAPEASPDHW